MELYKHFLIISRKILPVLQVTSRRFLVREAFFIGETKGVYGEILPAKVPAPIINWFYNAKAKMEQGCFIRCLFGFCVQYR